MHCIYLIYPRLKGLLRKRQEPRSWKKSRRKWSCNVYFSRPSRAYWLIVAAFALLLQGCAGHTLDDYDQRKPNFVAENFFAGCLMAYGVVQDRSGAAARTFTASIDAHWDAGVGYLDEQFVFDDGERQTRKWQLVADGAGRYRATANDVSGEGRASVNGNAFKLDYRLQINYRGKPLVLAVEDWMWLVDNSVLINQSTLRKFGVRVGNIVLTIIRDAC